MEYKYGVDFLEDPILLREDESGSLSYLREENGTLEWVPWDSTHFIELPLNDIKNALKVSYGEFPEDTHYINKLLKDQLYEEILGGEE